MIYVSPELKKAAEKTAGCAVTLQEFVPVVETFRGKVLWEGFVHQFTSANGAVYAWTLGADDNNEMHHVTVLGTPPINSPLDAVRAWLVSQIRK